MSSYFESSSIEVVAVPIRGSVEVEEGTEAISPEVVSPKCDVEVDEDVTALSELDGVPDSSKRYPILLGFTRLCDERKVVLILLYTSSRLIVQTVMES